MTSNLLPFPQERLLLLRTGFGALLLILLLLLILPDFFAGSVPEADSVGPLAIWITPFKFIHELAS